jgi:hypothetical protein
MYMQFTIVSFFLLATVPCRVDFLKIIIMLINNYYVLSLPTWRHGNFAGVHTLLRILLSSNSAVLINIITSVSPPEFGLCCVLCYLK